MKNAAWVFALCFLLRLFSIDICVALLTFVYISDIPSSVKYCVAGKSLCCNMQL